MSSAQTSLIVFLDAGVPDSVGDVFLNRKHSVILHRDVLPERTPDTVVCRTAIANNAILVAIDGDMKQFPKRYGISKGSDKFPKLNLIRLCLREPQAANRLRQCLSLIEHEWQFVVEKSGRRLWVDIEGHRISTHR